MKKSIITFACLATALFAQAQSKLELKVNGLTDGTVLEAYLGSTHQDEKTLTSATVNGGKADFNLPVTEPRMIDIRIQGKNGNILHLMTNKGEDVQAVTTVLADTYDNQTYYSTKDEKVYNSPMHAQYMMKLGAYKEYLTAYNNAYHDAYKNITDKIDAAYNAKDTVKMKALQNTQEYKDFLQCDAQFFKMLETDYPKMFAENKDTWWGAFMPLDVYSYFTDQNNKEYDQLSDEAKNSFYGKLLKEQVHPKGFIGDNYAKFNVIDANGKATASEELTKGKKYLLIDFWASWCAPCRKEIPNLKDCYALYKDKGLQIISVSIDRSDAAWKKALKEEQLPWPNGIDKEKIADAYKVRAIPAMFLVDVSTGKVIGENLRGRGLRDKLAELMK